MSTSGLEMRAQGLMIKELFGKEAYDALPRKVRDDMSEKWRELLDSWEAAHGGNPPDKDQLKWIWGVWLDEPPHDFTDRLTRENNKEK